MSDLRDLLRALPSADAPPPDVKEALFSRAKRGAEGRIVRARRVRIAAGTAGVLLSIVGAAMGLRAWGAAPEVAHQPTERVPLPSVAPSVLVEASEGASVGGRPIDTAALEGEVLALVVDEGGALTLRREDDRLHMDGEGALTLHTGTPLRVELLRGGVELEGRFTIEGPSCSCQLEGHARVAVQENESPDGAWSSTHVTMMAGSVEAMPSSSCAMTPLTLPLEEEASDEGPSEAVPDEGTARERPEVVAPLEAPEPALDPAVLLAERVDRLAQAQGLVSRDPEAALRALRALDAEWPDAPVEEEIETSIVEALIAGGHGDRSREAAERLVQRWGARHQALLDQAQALP